MDSRRSRRRPGQTTMAVATILLALSVPAQASWIRTVDAAADTMITKHPGLGGPDSSHGDATSLYIIGDTSVYHTQILVQFDLSACAGLTVVSDVVYRAHFIARHPAASAGNFANLIRMRQPWSEASTYTQQTPVVAEPWLGMVHLTPSHPLGYIEWTVPAWIVQDWIDHPATNYGLLMYSGTIAYQEDVQFASSETGTPPQLVMELVPEPTTMALLAVGAMATLRRRGAAVAAR